MDDNSEQSWRLTFLERLKVGFVWFIVTWFVAMLLTVIPAQIALGISERTLAVVTGWFGVLVGIAGAIYGRKPPPT
ncbi:MAG: hypothetical protein WCA36_16780 [Pseudolabrys sp.]